MLFNGYDPEFAALLAGEESASRDGKPLKETRMITVATILLIGLFGLLMVAA